MTTRKKRPQATRARRKRPNPKDGQAIAERSARQGVPEEDLQGPPARETTGMRDDRERAAEAHREEYRGTSPRLTGGDPDPDWDRPAHAGEEAVGGTAPPPAQTD